MTSITANQLRAGDIIVSTTGAGVSGVTRGGTGSSVSHSMLYIGNQNVIEAIATGVTKRTLTQALREASLAIALRRRNTTQAIRTAVVSQAESYASRRLAYDEIGAAGAGAASTNRGRLLASIACGLSPIACGAGASAVARNAHAGQADRAFFCSELVARVFELAGAPITDLSPSFTTPRHVRMSSQLLYVGHLKDT
ncbi:MAG: hypothetical protein ACI87W_002244 [Halieaceae bacterium]|jgi:uncharacterized protein YycO